jgi:hypothetical protein
MKNKESKREWDFFVMWSNKKEWYVIPTFVFFYNPIQLYTSLVTSPAWGLYFQWLKITAGVQVQKNPNYEN